MSEINRKREEAQRKLRAVQNKMSRLRREKGAEIAGTKHDVRVSRADIAKMRSRDLDRFIQRANQFTDRNTQFRGGANGVPLPASRAAYLQSLDTNLNAKHEQIMSRIGGIQAPFSGMSIADRERQMRPNVRAGGEAFNRTFEAVQTDIGSVRSPEGLEKLIKKREQQLADGYLDKRIKASRKQFDQMLTRIGADDMRNAADSMTDSQFFTFWEYGPYAGQTRQIYDILTAQEKQGIVTPSDEQEINDTTAELRESVSWAKSLPDGIIDTSRAKKAKRSARRRKSNRD